MDVSELTKKINSFDDDDELGIKKFSDSLEKSDIPTIEKLEDSVQQKIIADLNDDVWLNLNKNIEIGKILLERFHITLEQWKSNNNFESPVIQFELCPEKNKENYTQTKIYSLKLLLKNVLPKIITIDNDDVFITYIRKDIIYKNDFEPSAYVKIKVNIE